MKHREVIGDLLKVKQLINWGLISKSVTCLPTIISSSDSFCCRKYLSSLRITSYNICVDHMVVRRIFAIISLQISTQCQRHAIFFLLIYKIWSWKRLRERSFRLFSQTLYFTLPHIISIFLLENKDTLFLFFFPLWALFFVCVSSFVCLFVFRSGGLYSASTKGIQQAIC